MRCKHYCTARKQSPLANNQCKHYCEDSNDFKLDYEIAFYLSPLPVTVVNTLWRTVDSHWCRLVGIANPCKLAGFLPALSLM